MAAHPIRPLQGAEDGAPEEWPKLLPDAVFDGVTLTVLTTESDLRDEGRRGTNADGTMGLHHCVGDYAHRVRTARVRILSLRVGIGGESFARLSTAEIGLDAGYPLIQHNGPSNGAPPPEARTALRSYLDALRSGAVAVDREAVERERLANAKSDGGDRTAAAKRTCGYDFETPGAWEAVRDAWVPLLSRPMRGVDARVFVGLL